MKTFKPFAAGWAWAEIPASNKMSDKRVSAFFMNPPHLIST
jgi:hypothetical protein